MRFQKLLHCKKNKYDKTEDDEALRGLSSSVYTCGDMMNGIIYKNSSVLDYTNIAERI